MLRLGLLSETRTMFVSRRIQIVCLALMIVLCGSPQICQGLGRESFITFEQQKDDFILVQGSVATPFYVDSNDYPGVARAANDLSHDILSVTGIAPLVVRGQDELHGSAVIIGTLGRSALIDRLIREHKIDTSALQGK